MLVLQATSNDPWGPTGTQLSLIAESARSVIPADRIMTILWKRVTDKPKNWRHIYKSLAVLEYLLKTENPLITEECKSMRHQIEFLLNFAYYDESTAQDRGVLVRQKAQTVLRILSQSDRSPADQAASLDSGFQPKMKASTRSRIHSKPADLTSSPGDDGSCASKHATSSVSKVQTDELDCFNPKNELKQEFATTLRKKDYEDKRKNSQTSAGLLHTGAHQNTCKRDEAVASVSHSIEGVSRKLEAMDFSTSNGRSPVRPSSDVTKSAQWAPLPAERTTNNGWETFGSGSVDLLYEDLDTFTSSFAEQKYNPDKPPIQPQTVSGLNVDSTPSMDLAGLLFESTVPSIAKEPSSQEPVKVPNENCVEGISDNTGPSVGTQRRVEQFLGEFSGIVDADNLIDPKKWLAKRFGAKSVGNTNCINSTTSTGSPSLNELARANGLTPRSNLNGLWQQARTSYCSQNQPALPLALTWNSPWYFNTPPSLNHCPTESSHVAKVYNFRSPLPNIRSAADSNRLTCMTNQFCNSSLGLRSYTSGSILTNGAVPSSSLHVSRHQTNPFVELQT
ncbi:unnamed protein product [Calicophoron daubneyi]